MDNILSFTITLWIFNHNPSNDRYDCIITGANSSEYNELTICENHANINGSK